MDGARSDIGSLEQAATRLSLRIAELVQFGVPSGWRRAAKVDEAVRESLCHQNVLPALFTDPACRAHLTRHGGPIDRLATDIVGDIAAPKKMRTKNWGSRSRPLVHERQSARSGPSCEARRTQPQDARRR